VTRKSRIACTIPLSIVNCCCISDYYHDSTIKVYHLN
jgi:hypothetical protein